MPGKVNLVDLANRVIEGCPEMEALRPAVMKELVHFETLWCLDEAGFLNYLTLHGGTALRLCYGSNRLSEYLDFSAGPGFTGSDMDGISDVVRSHLVDCYGLDVFVREPKPRRRSGSLVEVDTWQISVVTHPGQPHLPRQKVRIDIATMEVRNREARALQRNYSCLPNGFEDMIVPAMGENEILANKLVSLPASVHQRNIRYRDIWDIAWLAAKGTEVNGEWVVARAAEFGLDDFVERLDRMRRILPDHIVGSRFRDEMLRFLPLDRVNRTLDRPDFSSHLIRTVDEQLAQARGMFA